MLMPFLLENAIKVPLVFCREDFVSVILHCLRLLYLGPVFQPEGIFSETGLWNWLGHRGGGSGEETVQLCSKNL